MAIGPIQLARLGLNHPEFQSAIVTEIVRLRERDTRRLIDRRRSMRPDRVVGISRLTGVPVRAGGTSPAVRHRPGRAEWTP
jgi:hypothetical protein